MNPIGPNQIAFTTHFLSTEDLEFSASLAQWCEEKRGTDEYKARLDVAEQIKTCYTTGSTELHLSNKGLTSIPVAIGKLKNLKDLYLDNNKIISLPKAIGKLEALLKLTLSKNELQTLPEEIGNLTALDLLLVYSNKFVSLPKEIGNLTALKQLSLSDNKLTSIPKEISNLTALEQLNLSNNNLASLPEEIGHLTALSLLELSHNQFTSLPREIGQLTALKELFLHRNQLASLPEEIGHLTALSLLNLSKNPLTSLPVEIGQLRALKNLYISSTQLTSLPLSLGNIASLLQIETENNPQLDIGLIRHILNTCRAQRDLEAPDILKQTLALWKQYAKSDIDLSFIMEDQTLIPIIQEWLTRLSKTKEFVESQQELAQIACQKLAFLKNNPDFKNQFLAIAEPNNTACEDRSAMSFNLTFTLWKLYSLDKDAPFKEKLALYLRAAKTYTLRDHVSKLVNRRDTESVEVYLYVETALREELNLLSAIRSGTYSDTIGNKSYINLPEIANHVKTNYMNCLFDIQGFEDFAKQDPAILAVCQQLEAGLLEKYETIDKMADKREQERDTMKFELGSNLATEKRQLLRTWATTKLNEGVD